MAKRLFVGNLSFKITQEELESLFAEEGTVTSTAIIMDRFSGSSGGFGFTDMDTESEAMSAMERFNEYQSPVRLLTGN